LSQGIEGSVGSGNGQPPPPPAGAPEGSNGAAVTTDWTSGLADPGNRELVVAKGWKNPDQAIGSYKELESRLGSSLTPPKDDDPPEKWDQFYGKLGRPEKPDGYELKVNKEAIPESFPYDGQSADKFKVWAHKHGLTPKQAQGLHDEFVADMAGQFGGQIEAQQKQVESAHVELVRAWGTPDNPKYQQNVEFATRAIRENGGPQFKDELVRIGAMTPEGDIKAPILAKALAKMGQGLYKEDSIFGGEQGHGENPWKDGDTFSMTKQGQILKHDPDRAKTLIRLAGKNPAEFGL
jgi:hypothetical protein